MKNLKLKAEDIEDITILSAYLQDAITKMADMSYQSQARQFVIMLNRFVWEAGCAETDNIIPDENHAKNLNCSRIRTGLHFDEILNIHSQNITITSKDLALELLSIEAQKNEKNAFLVDLIFSGDGVIRLECEMISAHMQDIGEPWPAKCHPKHEILDALQDEKL